jgi:hypothetical protein
MSPLQLRWRSHSYSDYRGKSSPISIASIRRQGRGAWVAAATAPTPRRMTCHSERGTAKRRICIWWRLCGWPRAKLCGPRALWTRRTQSCPLRQPRSSGASYTYSFLRLSMRGWQLPAACLLRQVIHRSHPPFGLIHQSRAGGLAVVAS